MLHDPIMESNRTDYLKSVDKLISASKDGEANEAVSLVSEDLVFADGNEFQSASPASQNTFLASGLRQWLPTQQNDDSDKGTSESQEILLDANFFMNGLHVEDGYEQESKKTLRNNHNLSATPDIPKTPRSSLRKVLAMLDGLTASNRSDTVGGTPTNSSYSSLTPRDSEGPTATNSASSRDSSTRPPNGRVSSAFFSCSTPVNATTQGMSSSSPEFGLDASLSFADGPHNLSFNHNKSLIHQRFGICNNKDPKRSFDRFIVDDRTSQLHFSASPNSSSASFSPPTMCGLLSTSSYAQAPGPDTHETHSNSIVRNRNDFISSYDDQNENVDINVPSLMNVGDSQPISHLHGDVGFSSGSFRHSSSDGGLIGWRPLLGEGKDSWGHPSHFSPPSTHIRYKNDRGDGPSSGCFINESELRRKKEQEMRLARHFEMKWEEMCRKAEFHPRAKVRFYSKPPHHLRPIHPFVDAKPLSSPSYASHQHSHSLNVTAGPKRHSPNAISDPQSHLSNIALSNSQLGEEKQESFGSFVLIESGFPSRARSDPSPPARESLSPPGTPISTDISPSIRSLRTDSSQSFARPTQSPLPSPSIYLSPPTLHRVQPIPDSHPTPPASPHTYRFEPPPFANPLLFSLLRTRPFYLTLLVAGESGLGKSTLIDSLFLTDIFAADATPMPRGDERGKTLQVRENKVEIQERGIRLRLTVVDTPGFGDAINNDKTYRQLCDVIDSRFKEYQSNEHRREQWEAAMNEGKERSESEDRRIHCCLYFIRPGCEGLRSLDIQVLRGLQKKVNIIPVIGKADTLTKDELLAAKAKVRTSLKKYGINVYEIPACDPMEDLDILLENENIRKTWPLAVCGANSVFISGSEGRRVRGRRYPWGVVDIENPDHCDFVRLRSLLVSQLENLKQKTHQRFYAACTARIRTDDEHNLIATPTVMSKSGSMPNLKSS